MTHMNPECCVFEENNIEFPNLKMDIQIISNIY